MSHYHGYGQPQPQHHQIYGQAPPNYEHHMAAQHMGQQPQHGYGISPHQSHAHAQHHMPLGHAPHNGMGLQQHLKRQASQLRTQYPDTRWCAVFVDYSTSAVSDQKDDFIDETELLQPIPKTNTSGVELRLEESVLNDVMTWQDKDKEESKKREDAKKEIEAKKEAEKKAKEDKENGMIDDYCQMSGNSNREEARRVLEKNNWNMEEAVSNLNFSSANVVDNPNHNNHNNNNDNSHRLDNYNGYNLQYPNSSNTNNGNNGNYGNDPGLAYGGDYGNNNNNNNNYDNFNSNYNSNSVSLRMILPNNETITLGMEGSDTIWGLYAKLLQQRPEFSQKPFTFELTSGRRLQETDFDSTLSGLNLVPNGEVRVVY